MDINNTLEWIGKLLPALVAFSGAWFGSRWGLTKFKKEKFWEEKIQAYGKVIAAAENVAFWGQQKHLDCYGELSFGRNMEDQSIKYYSDMRVIVQMEYTASIYFSKKFAKLISQFNSSVKDDYSSTVSDLNGERKSMVFSAYADLAGRISHEAYRLLDALNAQAKIDLGGDDISYCVFLKEKWKAIICKPRDN